MNALKTAVVIEDDPDIRHLLSEVLEAAGFSVVSVGNGIDGVRAVFQYQPLITTLDVNMPGIDGFEAARRIRAGSDTYIIMLTALADEADVVLGLGAGADEYLNKPFRPRELRARIEAMLRRPRTQQAAPRRQDHSGPSFPMTRPIPISEVNNYAQTDIGYVSSLDNDEDEGAYSNWHAPEMQTPQAYATQAAQAPREPQAATANDRVIITPPAPGQQLVQTSTELTTGNGWVTHRDLALNSETRVVRVQNRDIELTRTEFELLAALMESKRRVRSKADLTLLLRGESYVTSYFVGDADKRAIEAHMTNLRRKLGDNPTQPRYIETVRGVGYRLTTAVTG